jgi:undecaprenyl-diphosphatase
VIIPAFLAELGMDVSPPSLAVLAVLHLGTLAAILVYYRSDVSAVLRFRTNPEGRKIALLVGAGTIPVLIGLPLVDAVERLQVSVSAVGWQLMATGLILYIGQLLATGHRHLADFKVLDAILVGLGQALALIPGISRSGVTITVGNARGFEPTEAARFAFLLGIPAIAGAGLSQLFALEDSGGFTAELVVGMLVAAVSGYFAIEILLRSIRRIGLMPFAVYCLLLGLSTVLYF